MQYFQVSFSLDSSQILGSRGFRNKLTLPWNDLIPKCVPRNLKNPRKSKDSRRWGQAGTEEKNGLHGRRGNTEWEVARWCHPVASGVAVGMLHWVMHFVSHRRTTMAIEMAGRWDDLFSIIDFCFNINVAY